MAGGRPRIISSPEEAWERGQAFFDSCRENGTPFTVTGLSLALGLNGRQSLIEYENRDEFSDTIKALKAECERYAEEKLYGGSAGGPIFALKNYGWKDTQDVNQNIKAHITAIEEYIIDP